MDRKDRLLNTSPQLAGRLPAARQRLGVEPEQKRVTDS